MTNENQNNAAQPGLTDELSIAINMLISDAKALAHVKAKGYDASDAERCFQVAQDRVCTLLSKLRAEGVQAGGFPAYINDDSQPLQYRLGWNNCLSDCRAALASAPVAEPEDTREDFDIWCKKHGYASSGSINMLWSAWREALKHASAPVAGAARGDDAAQMAGLESSINILSALVDHQRLLLVEVEDVCGRDVHGGPLEDGESDLIDRVRQHLAATIPAAQSAANAPIAEEAARIIKLPAVDSALATFIENSDGNTALVLVQAILDAAPQASEAVRNQALDDAEEAVVTLYESDDPVYLPDIALAIRALKTQADKDGGDCAKGAGDVV